MTTDLRIKELCAQRGITQKDLAARLGIRLIEIRYDEDIAQRLSQELSV